MLRVAAIVPAVVGIAATASADSIYWTNSSGGSHSEVSNWSPNRLPAAADTVLFTNAGAYTFTVDADATNASAIYYQGSITQEISAGVWSLTNAWRVGDSAGSTSRVTAVSGALVVTNPAGTALMSVGGIGTGELAVRGGRIVTDLLLATNGTRSIVAFGHGELTTLQGSTLDIAGKTYLGTTASNLFVWNALAGTNRIITGRYVYGGLTLGAASGDGRARVHLAGPTTVLSVPGLDTYGRNEIEVHDGAQLQTYSVQLGLGGGSSNVVVVAGAGSAWTNEYLMYFGMHAGSQTLVVSNGGYFRTGGTQYSDQRFHAFANPGNKILITGSNSWFHCDGWAELGSAWAYPESPLDNVLMVTHGGRFWARGLAYGSSTTNLGLVSRPGNLICISDGSMWIGSLRFAVGTLRIDAGSGIIDQLDMVAGTNAVLQARGTLYMGHHGDLGAGDLRVGGTNVTITSLSGDLQLGGWQLGVSTGCSADVTLSGGRALVTNAFQTAALIVGGSGSGSVRVKESLLCADVLAGGLGGRVSAVQGGTLRIRRCEAAAGSVSVQDATLEFTVDAPELANDAIVTTNATISFYRTSGAVIDLSAPTGLGRIRRAGRTILQLVESTNSPAPSLILRDGDAANWSGMALNGGTSSVQTERFLIETNSSLAATNTTATISGAFTNRGQIVLKNSTLRFVGPVTLDSTCGFQGEQGFISFPGGLHLPATDIVVPQGIAVQVASITSDGGRLILNGGGIIPNEDGTVASGMIVVQDGWVTYLDTIAVPLAPPAGLSGPLGLELIRSGNEAVANQDFVSGDGGYERLRLGPDGKWCSDQLVIGSGGAMFVAHSSATVLLTSGVFQVVQGGRFQDDSAGTNHVGFGSASAGAMAAVSGSGSTWTANGTLSVGSRGPWNELRVDQGGTVHAQSVSIGGPGGSNNWLILTGEGTSCVATNGLVMEGIRNEFRVETGSVFQSSQLFVNGPLARATMIGSGTVAHCTGQVVLSGSQSRLQIGDAACLYAGSAVLNAMSGASVQLSGEGSLWRLAGSLMIKPSALLSWTNRVVVGNDATLMCSSLSVSNSNSGRAELRIESGRVLVTNDLGTARMDVNGRLDLNGGWLHADRLVASSAIHSALGISAGRAEWADCDLAAGVPLRVGDGTGLATLSLLGGTNICRAGIEIRRFSRLVGRGTILGTVTNHGTFGPSAIRIDGDLVLGTTSALTFSIDGSPGSPQNSSLEVSGRVELDGHLDISVRPGVTVSNSQSFVLIEYGSGVSGFSNVVFGQRLVTCERLGSFRVDDTGSAIVARDYQSEDTDGDGIQDSWAMDHFGISPLLPGAGVNDLEGDWDGDRLSNRDEFVFRTDPTDPKSCLDIQMEPPGQVGVTLHFPYVPERSYVLRISEDLLNWRETQVRDFRFDASGLATWSDTNTATLVHRYYHLVIGELLIIPP